VAYTVQTTVDALHNIPIDLVTNENDSKAMGGMLPSQNYFKTQ
jgi:hypothetical protein